MAVKSSANRLFSSGIILDYLKGLLVAMLTSLGLIVLFAFCLNWFNMSDATISPINLAIKGLSVFLGSLFAIKGETKGLLKGSLFGAIYIFVALIVFSLLAGQFSVGIGFVLDLAFASLLGGLVGIFKVNKNSKY